MALPTPPTTIIPRTERSVPGGIFTSRHTQQNFMNGSKPELLSTWYKPSAALLLAGGAYLAVVGFNSNNELIIATRDSTDATNNVKPVGFLSNAIPANSTLHRASVYYSGNVNRDMLVWDATWADDDKEFAFVGAVSPTNIITGVSEKRPPVDTDTD